MQSIKEQSLIDSAERIIRKKKTSLDLYKLFDIICAEKGLDDDKKKEFITQFYTDLITSAKFVYTGNNTWDLKGTQKADLREKDGSFYKEYTVIDAVKDETKEAKVKPKAKRKPRAKTKTKVESIIKKAEVVEEKTIEEVKIVEEVEEVIVIKEEKITKIKKSKSKKETEVNEYEEEVIEEFEDEFDEEKYNEYMDTYENKYDEK